MRLSTMACRSCGLGPKNIKKGIVKPVSEPAVSKPHPSKGIIPNNKRKVSVPTKSPARTFNTLGDN